MEQRFLTPKEAISLLKKGKSIHTFSQTANALIGIDLKKSEVTELFKANPGKIQLAGENARNMGHGIVVKENAYIFIEHDALKLNTFDTHDL